MTNPIRLSASQDILIHPDNSVDTETLESLLYAITNQKVEKSTRVLITVEVRTKGFDPRRPSWEKYQISRTAGYLMRLYSRETGKEYVPKDNRIGVSRD